MPAESAGRRLAVSSRVQNHAEIGVKARHLRVDRNGLPDPVEGKPDVPTRKVDHPEQVKRIRLLRDIGQDALVKAPRFGKTTCLMMTCPLGNSRTNKLRIHRAAFEGSWDADAMAGLLPVKQVGGGEPRYSASGRSHNDMIVAFAGQADKGPPQGGSREQLDARR
jgi:hypothetical protein